MANAEKKRIELIDLAKALTIFLVILGHTAGLTDTAMYAKVIYTFHMPLFFFLAGMSLRPAAVRGKEGWRAFLKKTAQALVVPYIIWGLIYAPFSFENVACLLYASWKSLGKMGTLTSLWFLAALFIARTAVQMILNLTLRKERKYPELFTGISAAVMLAAGFLFPHLESGYPWCLDIAFTSAGFILAGIALRKPVLILAQQKTAVLAAVLTVSLLLLYAGTFLRKDDLGLILMCDSQYGDLFYFLLNSFSGSTALLSFCMLVIRAAREGVRPFGISAVTYIGMHTMGIFLLHKNILQQLIMPWLNSLFPDTPVLLTAVPASIITLILSVLFCKVIETYVPQLLGQFPRYGQQ